MKKTLYTETQLEDFGDGKKRRILSYNEEMMLVEVTFDQGGIGAAHSHPHRQISYVQSGLFVFACEDKEHTVGPGDSLLFEANVVHSVKCIEEGVVLDFFTPCRQDFL